MSQSVLAHRGAANGEKPPPELTPSPMPQIIPGSTRP